jgi:hypothetical protein
MAFEKKKYLLDGTIFSILFTTRATSLYTSIRSSLQLFYWATVASLITSTPVGALMYWLIKDARMLSSVLFPRLLSKSLCLRVSLPQSPLSPNLSTNSMHKSVPPAQHINIVVIPSSYHCRHRYASIHTRSDDVRIPSPHTLG